MNYLIFDTETINLEKAFIYNLGYCIVTEYGEILCEKDYVIRQVYDNKPLFATSYYAHKRPIYVSRMKGRTAKKVSWGTACREMAKDIKKYNIKVAYAYNSPFDVKAFYFNHLFYRNKCRPLDTIEVKNIMDYIGVISKTKAYKEFCRNNNFVTATNRVKTTAESMYAFITNNPSYKEEHTALADSIIEAVILLECFKRMKEDYEE